MGTSSSKIKSKKQNENILLNSITLSKIKTLPNDQYTCTQCKLIPEIIDIDYNTNEIEIKCSQHGQIRTSIKNYFLGESNYLYNLYICTNCKKQQNTNPLFNFCYICQKILCLECSNKHEHKGYLLPINEMNNNFKGFFDSSHCNIYEITYSKNEKLKQINTISEKEKETLKKYSPTVKDLEIIINQNNKILNQIQNLEYVYKFNETIIKTYEKCPYNYYHNINVVNLKNFILNNFKIEQDIQFSIINQKENLNIKYTCAEKSNDRRLSLKDNFSKLRRINDFDKIKEKRKINKIVELDLKNKNMHNNELKALVKYSFIYLTALNLKNNNISNINVFKNIEMPLIKNINLSYNEIEDINPLKYISNKIEILNLKNNNIKNIDIFKFLRKLFPEIKNINLINNDINIEENIDILNSSNEIIKYEYNNIENYELIKKFNSKYNTDLLGGENEINLLNKKIKSDGLILFADINFKQLKKLNLRDNDLRDLKYLKGGNFKQLLKLNLSLNNLKNIDILSKINLARIRSLSLNENLVTDINILEKVNFTFLRELNLGYNNIKDISVFERTNFNELNELYLNNNQISDIKALGNNKNKKLELLTLSHNNINIEESKDIIDELKNRIKNFEI